MDKLSNVAYDPDRHLADELHILVTMFDNRHATGDSLSANELLVQIPRDRFERLCRLSLEALQHRYNPQRIYIHGYKHPNKDTSHD